MPGVLQAAKIVFAVYLIGWEGQYNCWRYWCRLGQLLAEMMGQRGTGWRFFPIAVAMAAVILAGVKIMTGSAMYGDHTIMATVPYIRCCQCVL